MGATTKARPARIHIAKSPTRLAGGEVRYYAYVRYQVWDEAKGRQQPKPLAALGRVDKLDSGRLDSLGGFLKEWLRKDSELPFEALRERFQEIEPALRIVCSRDFGLRYLVEQAWGELGYKDAVAELAEGSDVTDVEVAIFALVLVQLIAPQSKLGLASWQGAEVFFPEGDHLGLQTLYRAMDVLGANYEKVEAKLVEQLRKVGQAGGELGHDSTSITQHIRYDDEERAAIEAQRQERGAAQRKAVVNDPPLRMRGHAKNKRFDLPQIVVDIVANEQGLIVHHGTHAGNTSDQTLPGSAAEALAQLGYKQPTWAGDAGMNSVSNRDTLRDLGFEYVLGEGVSRTKVVREVLSRAGRYQLHPDKPELSFKCVIAEAQEERRDGVPGPKRLYVIRRNRDEEACALMRIERHLAHVEEALAKGGVAAERLLRHRTYKRYVRRDGRKKDAKGRPAGKPIINRAAVDYMKKVAGKSVIGSDALDAHPLYLDDVYRSLFAVEAIFRDLKSTLRIGPVRHRRADRIRAHVMIAVMAHNLGCWLALRSGLTIERLRRVFNNLRVQLVELGTTHYWERTDLTPEQREVFMALGYDLPPKRFTVECDVHASRMPNRTSSAGEPAPG